MSFCPACQAEYPDDWKRCPKDEAVLLASRMIGKYTIEKIIGAGGMGAVYRALNPDTKSPVALKVLHASGASSEDSRRRFQREAASIAGLRTRHVVTIYDFGEAAGIPYLVMELLRGHTLRGEIAGGPMALPRINTILGGALRGLGSAHRAGITHRDLKPDNVFLADTDDGEVTKILDFGIARAPDASGHGLTQSGTLMGTPAYMAPEQVAGNRDQIGAWTDVYAMGVILYEMLTGQVPFVADTVSEILRRVLAREFEPLATVRPDLPKSISNLVDRALSGSQQARHANADALREAWDDAFRVACPDVAAGLPTPTPTPRPHKVDSLAETVPPTTDPPVLPVIPPTVERTAAPQRGPARYVLAGLALAAVGAGAVALVVNGRGRARSSLPDAAVAAARADAAAANGKLDPAVIRERVREHNAAIQACYERALATKPSLSGTVTARFTIDEGGRVAEAKASGLSAEVEACVETVVRGIQFPPPEGGRVEVASYPFRLRPAGPPSGMIELAGGEVSIGVDPARVGGAADADPPRKVTLAPYYLDGREVTVATYERLRASAGLPAAIAGVPDEPARGVSWETADKACKALEKRLPTEAEWEHAATRAALDPARARLKAKGVRGPVAVGTSPGDCSADGICDLLGNVSEWTADLWRSRAATDPAARAVRGGSYNVSPTEPFYASPYARVRVRAADADPEVGFRCAKTK